MQLLKRERVASIINNLQYFRSKLTKILKTNNLQLPCIYQQVLKVNFLFGIFEDVLAVVELELFPEERRIYTRLELLTGQLELEALGNFEVGEDADDNMVWNAQNTGILPSDLFYHPQKLIL